jgi:4-amino-4-deoxy-L-arabinose transferase-like glycosyltransferase
MKIKEIFLDISFLSITAGILFLLFLGCYSILLPEEAMYAEIAREMVRTGNYLTPHLCGTIFIDKPILYYWLESIAIKTFGLNEWALRFWPAIIGVFGVVFTYIAGHLLFNRRTGILAALILTTSPLYYALAHFANLDLETAVFISCSLLSFLIAIQETRTKQAEIIWMIMAYIFSALAFLTKGLIGIVFPFMIIGLWILFLQRWNLIKRMHLIIGASIFIAITAPWYILEQRALPDFFHYFFVIQNFSRFITLHFNNHEPFWFYLPIVLLSTLPWSCFVPQAIWLSLKTIKDKTTNYPNLFFLCLWIAVIFVFFSIPPSKLVGYIVPILPALALLIGNFFDKVWNAPQRPIIKVGIYVWIGLALLIALAISFLQGIQKFSITFNNHIFYIISVILISSAFFSFIFIKSRNLTRLFCTLVTTIALLSFIVVYNLDRVNISSNKPLTKILKPLLHENDTVVAFHEPSLDIPIYLDKNILIAENWQKLKNSAWQDDIKHLLLLGLNFSSNQKHWLIDDTELPKLWKSKQRVFIFAPQDKIDKLQKLVKSRTHFIARYNDSLLIAAYSCLTRSTIPITPDQ